MTDAELDGRASRHSTASLRSMAVPIGVSSALSIGTGLADSLAIAGLATYLASGIVGGSRVVLGATWLSEPWVILGLSVFTFVLNLGNTVLRERLCAQWDLDRRAEVLAAFEAAEYPVQAGQSGAGITVSLEQAGRASGAIGDLIAVINSLARTTIMMGVAFLAAWQVSLATVVAGGALVVSLRQLSKRTRRMNRGLAAKGAEVGELVGDVVGSVRELHLLNRWSDIDAWLGRELATMYRLRVRSRVMAGLVGPIFAMGTILVGLLVGIMAGHTGNISTSAIAASGILLIRALGAAQTTQVSYQSFHDNLPFMDRVMDVIEDLRAAARPPGTATPGPTLVLEAAAVRAGYGQDTVLHGLSVRLDGPGGIAIVGPSGSGKSTLLLALSGLVQPEVGTISLGGTDVRDLERHSVGAAIGYLAQDPRLLRDDLRSNLTRPELDGDRNDHELLAVLDRVGLRETVDAFDGGLDARMGRASEGFSGGELQRLGLARLLVNEPAVWLLDEPTSALDRANTDRVTSIVTDAMADHLVVVVTHRPELLAHCSRIVFIEDGVIVDDGPADEVAARQPFVASMLAGGQPGGG